MKSFLLIIVLIIIIYFPSLAQNFSGGDDDGFSVSGKSSVDVSALTYYAYIKNVTSSNSNGYYGIGQDIVILVEFDRDVYVSGGSPQIILETGATDRAATYVSGNGTKILTFKYTIVEGDSSLDLSYQNIPINLLGAQISDIFGNGATLDLPVSGTAGSLSFNKDLIIDGIKPVGTLDLAQGQADTTNISPVNYKLKFTEPVSGLAADDFSLTGTAGANSISVSGSGTDYIISVSGMTNDGNIVLTHFTASVQDTAGNWNDISTIVNNTVYYDATAPFAQIDAANTQPDPTNSSPVNFIITFNEAVINFDSTDIQLGGTAGAQTVFLTGGPQIFNAEINGMTGDGTVIINIPENVCNDSVGNLNLSSKIIKNQINYDISRPGIEIIRETGQNSPSNDTVISFRAIFTEQLNNFVPSNVKLSGTAGASTLNLRGGPGVYTIEVSGMTSDGSVIVSIPENELTDAAGNMNTASVNTDNQVIFDKTPPSVIISSSQNGQTNLNNIPITIEFSEFVIGFSKNNINISNGSISSFIEDVTGIKWTGTIIPDAPGVISVSVPENTVTDSAKNVNSASNIFSIEYIYVNQKPVVENQHFSIPENSPEGSFVGTVLADDPDGDNLSFSIVSGNIDDVFEIDETTGDIFLAAGKTLNYEIISEYDLIINVTDDAVEPESVNSELIISVIDVDEKFEANNIITPDDARNKYWIIKNIENYKDFELIIRTASGQIIYQTKNYNNDWDGRYNNGILPTGTYYYILTNPETNQKYTGFINLIRN